MMRDLITLIERAQESVLDFDNVRVQAGKLSLGGRYFFDFPTLEGEGCLFVSAFVEDGTETLNIYDIAAQDVEDHPKAYRTGNQDGYSGSYALGLRIGPAEVRRLLKFVLDRVRADGHKVKKLTGDRITGARTGKPEDARAAELSLTEAVENFAQWFGNSKVVDEKGAPLMVYHGTNQTFDSFSKDRGGMVTGPQAGAAHGFFFTDDPEEAHQYAEGAGRKVVANVDAYEKETERLRIEQERLERIAQRTNSPEDWRAYEAAYQAWEDYEMNAVQEDPSTGVNVISAFLSLQNPLEADFNGTIHSEHGVIEDVVAKALADGHDGVIMRNINDSPLGGFVSNHYVAFSPEQIKRV